MRPATGRQRGAAIVGCRAAAGWGILGPMTLNLGDGRIVVGTARTERADAIDLVRGWLDAMARRDFAAAAPMMVTGARVVISGGHEFGTLEDFAAFSAGRYATLRKQADAFETCEAPGGIAVYVRGTASGAFVDGTEFTGARWVDRFQVTQGRIAGLETWSDLAELRLARGAS